MSHDHEHHHHGHAHAPANFNRAFAIGIALNMLFVGIEAFYGWRVNSLALLADAGHNLSDVAGLVLAWGGALAGRLIPDARHTYGWKRATILAAFANALLLLVAIGALAWEAIGRLLAPPELAGVKLLPDEMVHPGQCLVETSQGAMISSFSDRMDDLADAIRSRE